jgi:excisionase family DNA binding protein
MANAGAATQDLLSVEQVAEHLGLHVRTVRRYVRERRLHAVRIGKQYRVSRSALEALTGATSAVQNSAPVETATRHVEVSSIVQAEAVDRATADRLTTGLLAASNGRSGQSDPLRIDTIYDPARARLKVILTGSLATTASLLKFVNAYLESEPPP